MNAPAFQFYAGDYLADAQVMMMTLEQEGAYIRLLAICWREGSIPADLKTLSMLCKGASPAVLRVVAKCFQPNPNQPGTLIHQRLNAEIEKQAQWRAKSVAGGKKSAEKRWAGKGGYKGGTNQSVTLQSSSSIPSNDGSAHESPPPPAGLSEELQARLAALPDTSGEVSAAQSPVLCQPAAFQALCDELGLGPIDHEHYRPMAFSAAKEKPGTRNEAQWRGFVRNFFTNQKQRGPLLLAKTAQLSAPTPSDKLPLPGKERPGQVIVIMGIETDASMNRMKLDSARKKWPTATVHAFLPGQRHD